MKIAVVIPSFKVKKHILSVIESIGPEVTRIYVVDDKCPENSGEYVLKNTNDLRVKVIHHEVNEGVGGAVLSGYKEAIKENQDIVVKIDGDGQMNPALITYFVTPIWSNNVDYTKGNRFYRLDDVKKMPIIRLLGNAVLSFFSKISTGYWHLFDPTNGYTAISTSCLKHLDLDKISKRYFFESDMLFRLNIIGATVKDIPMEAVYEGEESNLQIKKILLPFVRGHLINLNKRVAYDYFLRDFSLASVSLIFGLGLISFGAIYGLTIWYRSLIEHNFASSGTVMLSALPVIIGTQMLLNFLNYDISKSRNNIKANFPARNQSI